jgi:phospholipid transport system transporter-binding protein
VRGRDLNHPQAVSRREDNRLHLDGEVTIQTTARILSDAAAQVRDGVEVIDFSAVSEVDSAAVALALALVREARQLGRSIEFANLPPALANLASLYAVADFIPVAGR